MLLSEPQSNAAAEKRRRALAYKEETALQISLEEQRNYFVAMKKEAIQYDKYELGKNAGNSLSALQHKIILYLISRIKPDDTDLYSQTFNIKEFCSICGMDTDASGSVYLRIKAAIKGLSDKSMWLTVGEKDLLVRWIYSASITRHSGDVTIFFDPNFMPYLIGLSGDYTMFPLRDILKMRSKYGIVLYKLLHSYVYYANHDVTISIKDLRASLDCMGSSYDKSCNFRARVLEPAVADINKFSELSVSYYLRKTGREYTDVTFTITNLRKSTNPDSIAEYARRCEAIDAEFCPL